VVATQRQIPNAGGSFDGTPKVKLSLRQLKYETELHKMGLPRDAEGIIHSMLRLREQSLAVKYNLAFHYTLLKKQGEFWKASNHKSLDAWLAAFDLPMGATLAAREAMVRLFSKETFILAGDDILGEMIFEVSRWQADPEKKRKDYQRIFDQYCKTHDAFDKAEFRTILRWYVRTRYVNRTLAKVTDNTAPIPKPESVGMRQNKVLREVESSGEAQTEIDFVVETSQCAGCKAWRDYAETLETIIRSELGAKRLPKRPQGLN
jgi:hypothetical protein